MPFAEILPQLIFGIVCILAGFETIKKFDGLGGRVAGIMAVGFGILLISVVVVGWLEIRLDEVVTGE